MKAAVCKSLDGPDAIVIEELAPPCPGSGEILVAVKAAALNFMDTLICRGKYQYKPELPFSPAAEISGVVEELGAGVGGIEVGQRVCAYIGWGGARETVVLDAAQAIPVPDAVSHEVAAGISVTYGTAFHGLKERGELATGESLAVLGASGGAGLAALEIGSRLGARVIAIASSDERLRLCKAHGADEILNYASGDLRQELRELTGGKGVDVIYDCVGGEYAEVALRAMGWGGRYLVVGFASGQIPRIALNLLLLKGCDMRGVFWSKAVELDPGGHRANMLELLDWIAKGELAPHIHGCYPLQQIGEAITLLEQRQARGKVIVTL